MKEKSLRDRALVRTSWVSTVGNVLLSLSKIIVGLLSGSLAVISDGIDSAIDVIISVVMIFTARIVSRPPNLQYAYGYEKAEGIATKILSLVIFYAGVQMLISSVQSLLSPEAKDLPGVMAIYVTAFSIIGKSGLSFYQYRQGKRINSSLLIANAKNMRNDVIISVGVLAGLFFTFVLRLPVLDTVTGFIISLFIIKTSIGIFMDSNADLMDGVKDVSVYNKIFEAVKKIPDANNPHRVRSRQIGNLYMIALDIEADGGISLNEAHNIAEAVEDSIKRTVENVYDIVVHVEPIGTHRSGEKFGINEKIIK
ncbi:MAG: cation diffusion facilitator family transporter [Mediterranea sp.]|jgi:cation diffusion facilitator family transporter|nr:cation diffusion facilitator family transporter [Mediterranea sp.]